MKYRAFGDFRKGYAHVKNGSGVEDYASSYNDPEGRFYIGVICDGHSDKNCFRSGKGAQFGCESAIEILKRFFKLYFSQNIETRILPDGFENRLKKSLKLCWDKKVYNDIKENPLKKEELAPLTDRVRKIYEAGNGLLNIYGATFLAIGICEDFFIALHIGDGVILCVDADGAYYSPVPQDAKSETGAPASLCDADLFSRENAFRIGIVKKLPQVATVSSDGIEDCMDSFEYKRFIYSLFKKIEIEEEEDQLSYELNEKQKKYFASCLEYYADKGHGAEDDCSLAAFYDLTRSVPEVRISNEEAIKLWNQTMQERNEVVRDYENRKSRLLESMSQIYDSNSFKGGAGVSMDQLVETHEKFEEQKRTLKTIVTNENEKIAFYERQLSFYSRYIEGGVEENSVSKKLSPHQVDESLMLPDEDFLRLKNFRWDYQRKRAAYKQHKNGFEDTAREKDQDTKEASEKVFREYEAAKSLYDQIKSEYLRNRTKMDMDFQITHNDNRTDRKRASELNDTSQRSRRFHIGFDFPWFW